MIHLRRSLATALFAVITTVMPAFAYGEADSAFVAGNPVKAEFFPKQSPVADGPEKVHIAINTRFDFSYKNFKDGPNEAGFYGRYLNLMVYGEVLPGLSYNWRQRMNKFGEMKNDVFGATDWIYLTYRFGGPNRNWAVSGGKQVVAIGGYEYDAAPIDIFFSSIFWNNIACYQFGASLAYTTNNGKHTFTAQFCNSPFGKMGDKNFAYNLMWSGHMGWLSTLWSVNLMQYEGNRLANYISLGNKADFGKVFVELDIHNRYAAGQKFLFGDFSLIGKVNWSVSDKVNLFLKGGYERYRQMPGVEGPTVEKPFIGAGVEVFPIKNYRNLRLHAAWDVNHGNYGELYQHAQVGVTWRVELLSVR